MNDFNLFLTLISLGTLYGIFVKILHETLTDLTGKDRPYYVWIMFFTPIVACLIAILDKLNDNKKIKK